MSIYPKIVHHKFCIIDNKILYNGSYNWTYYAEKLNIENTIRFESEDSLIKSFSEEFNNITKEISKSKKVEKFTLEELIQWYKNNPGFNYFSNDLMIKI